MLAGNDLKSRLFDGRARVDPESVTEKLPAARMFPVRVDLIRLLALRLRPNHGIEAKPYHLVEAYLATGTLVPLKLAE
jgi:hypothetical protein